MYSKSSFRCVQISVSLLVIQAIVGLQITEFKVPSNPRAGDTIQLICNYDLGKDSLYVFKMYKDNSEFYRFIPLSQEKKQEFALPGITLDLSKCNETSVTLVKINTLTTGNFTCEVSVEESFETAPMVRELVVNNESQIKRCIAEEAVDALDSHFAVWLLKEKDIHLNENTSPFECLL